MANDYTVGLSGGSVVRVWVFLHLWELTVALSTCLSMRPCRHPPRRYLVPIREPSLARRERSRG